MVLTIHLTSLVAVVAFATLSTTSPLSTNGRSHPVKDQTEEDHPLPPLEPSDATDSYQTYQLQPPLDLQLPRVPPNPTSFNPSEPESYLKPPQDNQEPNYYLVPIPNQELVAPEETEWNPQNDPNLYYEIPVALTRQQLPTRQFPKKFIEELHLKKKPYANRPKQEVILQPIDGKRFETKQREMQKKLEMIEKKENRELLKDAFQKQKAEEARPTEAEASQSGDQEEVASFSSSSFDQGLSGELISSLGIPAASQGAASPDERLQFHMVGQDGPLSYKWGFDTGKGHNRQFRFEERDKEGKVRGHYGYYDKQGKLRIVHYDAHPHDGFHAENNFENS